MTPNFRGKTIALIGGAGFIGHHLALALSRADAKVAVVDSLQVNNLLAMSSALEEVPNRELYLRMLGERLELLRRSAIQLYPQDARDYHALSRILDTVRPDVVVHLAAVAHAGRSNKTPFSTFDHSLRTLENALDWARDSGLERFVFFSSSMVYGNFQTETVGEDHPLEPIGIYGALKLGGEKLVIAYNQVFGLPYTIVRPSALYGPRCVSRRVGQVFIESALEGRPLRIEGDGSERLDFTHIDDLVAGIALVIARPEAKNQIFNLTYGQARSVQELAEIVQDHFPAIAIERGKRPDLMPTRGTLAIAKAAQLLGYQPAHPLEVGIPRYIAWYRTLVSGAPQEEAV